MQLPIELWNLILNTHNLDSYKSCLQVNKLFYKIIKKFINDIPNKIKIEIISHKENLICTCVDRMHNKHICDITNPKNDKEKWFDDRSFTKIKKPYIASDKNTFMISKYDVLMLRQVHQAGFYGLIELPINLILSEKRTMVTIKYGYCSWHTGGPKGGAICYI
mgnify:FL=1